MEEEKNNVLFSQDDLISEPTNEAPNNLENGYTEELDFLKPQVQQAMETPVAPEPIYDAPVEPVPVEPTYAEKQEAVPTQSQKTDINENPMGKIKLNKQEEQPVEQIDPATIKLDFKGNNNLKYVIILGIILLIVVIVIPMFVTKFI